MPTFKSKRGRQSSYHPNGKVLADAIQLPKMTPIRAVIHRDIIGVVSSITVSRGPTGKYYASILCDDGCEAPAKPTFITDVTGCDMGLSHYLIESSGKRLPTHGTLLTPAAIYGASKGTVSQEKGQRQPWQGKAATGSPGTNG